MRDDDDSTPELDMGDLDPDAWAWFPGVDYLTGWRAARTEAERLNAALTASGVERAELRAVACTVADGAGMVRLLGTVAGARKLAWLLEEINRLRGAA
ncbi:hypothetical protein ABZS86_00010 [Streptomyces sp. NPDC005355]|uniref:hypothetical protein n=1 Tax=Streptomyces sp. NPDC005355 TaxID=3157038 RepID=UPI0033AB2F89